MDEKKFDSAILQKFKFKTKQYAKDQDHNLDLVRKAFFVAVIKVVDSQGFGEEFVKQMKKEGNEFIEKVLNINSNSSMNYSKISQDLFNDEDDDMLSQSTLEAEKALEQDKKESKKDTKPDANFKDQK